MIRISFLSCVLLFAQNTFAQPFTIVPFKPLPTTVASGGTVAAYYTVTNITTSSLEGFVQTLPANVTQIKCDPNFCGPTFTLAGEGDSCILKLTVAGAVDPNTVPQLTVCASGECLSPSPHLAVTEVASHPLIAIGAGRFLIEGSGLPLVAVSNDSGLNWDYPASIYSNLKLSVDPNLQSGLLNAASCTGVGDKSLCIASGDYCVDAHCYPLVAVSGKGVNTDWSYPKDIYENLATKIDSDLVNAFLLNASCTGSGNKSICIAAGQYLTPNNVIPLAAVSNNAGKNWTYPTSLFQNLTTSIDPNFKNGFFSGSSCTGTACNAHCITAGRYCSDELCINEFPLVGVSQNGGKDWVYPNSIFQNLNTSIDPNFVSGFFSSASCTGSGDNSICIAAGEFFTQQSNFPLLALTRDGGTTWSYPSSIFKDLQVKIGPDFKSGYFKSASCNGSGSTAVCIATGVYSTATTQFPLLALSSNGGETWEYPAEIFTNLNLTIDPGFVRGGFEGAGCSPTGICTASGSYCSDSSCETQFPLLAFSDDNGANWHYPSSIFSNLTSSVDPNFSRGLLFGTSCTSSENQNMCVATGEYYVTNSIGAPLPLLVYSTDKGNTWHYPAAIHENLASKLDPTFVGASLIGAAATGGSKLTPDRNILGYNKKQEGIRLAN